ncbi:MAG: DUF998 domain-containing protein [Candidatus Hodarchaeota archaeon]
MVRFLKKEDLKSRERLSGLLLIIAAISYIILTFIAMRFYPGSYSFTKHTFSYLGQIKVNGADNTIARILLIIACTFVAVALVPFWLIMPLLFKENKIPIYLSRCGSLLGLVAALFLPFIAIIPLDWGYEIHMIPTDIFFFCMAAAILIYSIAIFFNSDYHNLYGVIFLGFSIIVFLYIFRFFDMIRPTMQRIIVYSFMLWAFVQVAKIWKITSPEG